MHISMNNKPLSYAELETALASRLRELLGGVEWLHQIEVWMARPDAGFDLLAELPLPGGGKAALCVECKSELRPSLFRQFAERKFSPTGNYKAVVRTLALPWISPRIAELCAEHGWSWFDLAGNHRLDIPGLLRLQRTGCSPVHSSLKPTANLSTPEAGRVIRALLVPDNTGIRWTQREMQNHCQPNVSLGLVNKVIRHLRDEAFIEESNEGFHLRDPLKLLSAWRDAYRFEQHERRGYFTLLQGKKLREVLYRFGLHVNLTAYASFSAAEFQAPHVRQLKTWLYVRQQDLSEFEEMVEAKPVDSGDNVVVLIPDDEGIFYMADGGVVGDMRLACTNGVQTYVDLYYSGGRGQEAAEALLDQRLKREWKERGMKL
jgi:hypothetical protein